MTRSTSFKRTVRSRMAKTGESYTAARAQLLPAPQPAATTTSDDAVQRATGRPREEWFALLDAWDATAREHREIAAWLTGEHGVPGWWAQSVTVDYERARGLRALGSGRDGLFRISASRTVGVPVERAFEAFVDPEVRERWLPGAELRERTARPPRSARFDWGDGSSRVHVVFDAKGEAKSTASLQHVRLADGDEAERMKAFWRDRVSALKAELER